MPIPKPKKQCLFCANTKLTKEHIYGKWVRDHVPLRKQHSSATAATYARDAKSGLLVPSWEKGKLNRPGDPLSQTLRVVCQTCNNNWMSEVVNKAKPYLIPLFKGKWPVFDAAAQRAVATWAVLVTMVFEQSHPPTAAVVRSQREYLKAHLKPPKKWKVWVAKYEGQHHAGAWHRALHIEGPDAGDPSVGNTHMTIFGIGKALFVILGTSVDHVPLETMSFTSDHSLSFRCIWPLHPRYQSGPQRSVSDKEIASAQKSFLYILLGPDHSEFLRRSMSTP